MQLCLQEERNKALLVAKVVANDANATLAASFFGDAQVFVLSRSSGRVYYFIDGVQINSCDYRVGSHNPSMDGTITVGGGHLRRNFENRATGSGLRVFYFRSLLCVFT